MAAQTLSISWNNNTGGLSDNKYQALQGRFSDGQNISIRQYGVKLSQENTLIHTYNGVGALFNTDAVGGGDHNIVWESNTNNILRDGVNIATGTVIGNGTRIAELTLLSTGITYLYYFKNSNTIGNTGIGIHRTNLSGGGILPNHLTYIQNTGDVNNLNNPVVYSQGGRILFSAKNKLYELTNDEIIAEVISFPSIESIVGITYFQGQFKIYTNAGNTNTVIYKWSDASTTNVAALSLPGLSIQEVVNKGAYDYMRSSSNDLYEVAGIQYRKLYKGTVYGLHGNINDKIYTSSGETNSNISLSTLGSEPGYTTGLSPDFRADTASSTGIINNITTGGGNIYYSLPNGKLYKVGGNATNGTTGYITSLVLKGANIQFEKQIEYVILKYKLNTGSHITLACQIQENGSWITLWSGNNTTIQGNNNGLKLHSKNFTNPIGTFNTIKFRITITSTGLTTTDTVYGLDIIGNQDIGK